MEEEKRSIEQCLTAARAADSPPGRVHLGRQPAESHTHIETHSAWQEVHIHQARRCVYGSGWNISEDEIKIIHKKMLFPKNKK